MEKRKDMKARPGHYAPGCIVSLPVATEVGIVKHKGILSDRKGPDGYPMVIHAAKLRSQGVIEAPMTSFFEMARGPLSSEGYPSLLSPKLVLERARSRIGVPWKLLDNCEHFAAWCHGMPKKSPELRRKAATFGAVAVGGALFVLTRGAI